MTDETVGRFWYIGDFSTLCPKHIFGLKIDQKKVFGQF